MKTMISLSMTWLLLFLSACNFEDPYTLNVLTHEQTGSASEKVSTLTTQGHSQREVRYNFEKFLFGRTGYVIGRYSSDVLPLSEEIRADIERALAFPG